jgi:hypothetical protein
MHDGIIGEPFKRHLRILLRHPPAKPGALVCEPLKAAAGSLARPRKTTGDSDAATCRGALLKLPGHFPC